MLVRANSGQSSRGLSLLSTLGLLVVLLLALTVGGPAVPAAADPPSETLIAWDFAGTGWGPASVEPSQVLPGISGRVSSPSPDLCGWDPYHTTWISRGHYPYLSISLSQPVDLREIALDSAHNVWFKPESVRPTRVSVEISPRDAPEPLASSWLPERRYRQPIEPPMDGYQVLGVYELSVAGPMYGLYPQSVPGPGVLSPGSYHIRFVAQWTDGWDSATNQTLYMDNVTLKGSATLTLPVSIDIKPGDDTNPCNCRVAGGEIPVAILGAEGFDVTAVDADTVRFGKEGSEAAHAHRDRNGSARRHLEDVNGDGRLDMLFHFRMEDAGFSCADVPAGEKWTTLAATLTGKTVEGRSFQGTDSLRLLSPRQE